MSQDLHEYWHQVETQVIDKGHTRLANIWRKADRRMFDLRTEFYGLGIDGKLTASPQALVQAANILDGFQAEIEAHYVQAGKGWTKGNMPALLKAGREMVRKNLDDVAGVDRTLLKAAMENVSVDERAILKVGFDDQYRIIGTVGDDIGKWMRQTLMDAMVEGIPVQASPGQDSLMARLYESGRLKPVTIRTKEGKLITRSVKQRAQAIARIEPMKIINRVHQIKGDEALGGQALWKDSGPLDSRTTQICLGASAQAPMSRQQWAQSQWGLPPRVQRQFHLCRHFLIAVLAEWVDEKITRARDQSIKKVEDLGDLKVAA
jgi:hypothetical protein